MSRWRPTPGRSRPRRCTTSSLRTFVVPTGTAGTTRRWLPSHHDRAEPILRARHRRRSSIRHRRLPLGRATIRPHDDEPGCEYSSLLGLAQRLLAAVSTTIVSATRAGTSSTDLRLASRFKLHNSLIDREHATRGALIDASNWDLFNNIWYRNNTRNGFNVNFTHGGKIRRPEVHRQHSPAHSSAHSSARACGWTASTSQGIAPVR